MDELLQEINAAKELISRTLAELKNALPVEDKTALELAGISIFLQNAYNRIENIFKRILLFKKISVPDSKTSHKDLLDIVVENGIISFELSENIDKYRAFRHFSIHGYGINLGALSNLMQHSQIKSKIKGKEVCCEKLLLSEVKFGRAGRNKPRLGAGIVYSGYSRGFGESAEHNKP